MHNVGGDNPACRMKMWVFKKIILELPPSLCDIRTKGFDQGHPVFRLQWCHHFSAIDMCWLCFLCLSGAGVRKRRQGHGICDWQTTKTQQLRKQLIFHVWLLPRCFTHVTLGWWSSRPGKKRGDPHHRNHAYCYLEFGNVKSAIGKLQCAIGKSKKWTLLGGSPMESTATKAPCGTCSGFIGGGHGVQARNLPRGFPHQIEHAQPHFQINANLAFLCLWGGWWMCTNPCRLWRGSAAYLQFNKKKKKQIPPIIKKTNWGHQSSFCIVHLWRGGDSLGAFQKHT